MTSPQENAVAMQDGAKGEPITGTSDQANVATDEAGHETTTTMEGVAEEEEEEACDDESEGDIPFEPFDINDDGRILKTASQCSRGSWKRPEAGWDVTITVHRFCERSPPEATTGEANDTQEDDAAGADVDVPSSLPPVVSQVEPDFLQLAFRLGEDDDEGFPQETTDQAKVAGVELHSLLHCGIETMGKNERATFVVTADGVVDDAERDGDDSTTTTTTKVPPRRYLEYDISLDDWIEEIDLSEGRDNSLVKRVMRDGDGVTRPVDIAGITLRCSVLRMPIEKNPLEQQGDDEELGGGTVLFDNLQSQDDNPTSDEGEGLEGPLSFILDDCPLGPGVTTVLKSMTRGEQCEAWLDPKHGPVDPQDDGSFYHQVVLELVEVEELPPVFAAEDIRLEMSSRFKLEGNDKFAAGDYIRASRRYEKAIKYADGVPPGEGSEDGEEGNETSSSDTTQQANDKEEGHETDNANQGEQQGDAFVDLQVAVLCNQAACFLKLGDGPSALEVADRASSLKPITDDSPAGIKAAYRRACALEAVGDWSEARDAFKRVLDVDPKNAHCRQGLARLARAKKAYEANLRKTFGGCLASNKLKGFASEGREVPESSSRSDDNNFDGGRGLSAAEDEDGPWTEGSESETVSGDEDSGSDGDEEDDKEKEEERVDALYKLATGGEGGGDSGGEAASSSLVHEENTTGAAGGDTTTAAEPGKEAVAATTTAAAAGAAAAAAAAAAGVTGGAGAAPSSEPTADEVISLSSLPALAKEFAVVDTPSKEPHHAGLPVKECSKVVEAAGGTQQEDGAIAPPVPPS